MNEFYHVLMGLLIASFLSGVVTGWLTVVIVYSLDPLFDRFKDREQSK